MLKQFSGDGKIVSVVNDSYDLYNALENIWGGELRDQVVHNGGLVILRPDSGNPVDVVCQSLDILAAKFGAALNSKGYKVLPSYIRLIQGDGISVDSIDTILSAMEQRGYSADNIVFGMGGELLQKMDRDTQKYAMKASAVRVENEELLTSEFERSAYQTPRGWNDHVVYESAFDLMGPWRDVFKNPKTDPGKKSKKGILALMFDERAGYVTCRRDELKGRQNLLTRVFRNGELIRDIGFDQVRRTADETTRRLEALGMIQVPAMVA